MPVKVYQQPQSPRSNKLKVKKEEDYEETEKVIDSVDLSVFDKNRHDCSTDAISKSRAGLLEKKARRIEDLLKNSKSKSYTYFRDVAATNGGLVRCEFRAEIWPILAENLTRATHLDKNDYQDSSDSYSLRSRQYLAAPNGYLLATSSRTGSESEVYDSARSSWSADGSIVEEEAGEAKSLTPVNVPLEELQAHAEWNQVELDVHRTLARFPPNISESERLQLQSDLIPMIVELLCGNDDFRYYQGFHDVCLTLMLALDIDDAKKVARRLVELSAFRNYLTKSLEESALQELHLMYVILHQCDPKLERRMRHAELGTLFALSWPITWFSHALHSFDQIALCFDLFLSSHALMPIYVSAALIEHRRDEIFAAEPEMPILHHLLNHVPESLDIEAVLQRARKLCDEYPPASIQGEFSRQYDDMCEFEGRQHSLLPANTIKRHSLLQTPLIISGMAIAAGALYWWIYGYQKELFTMF